MTNLLKLDKCICKLAVRGWKEGKGKAPKAEPLAGKMKKVFPDHKHRKIGAMHGEIL